jgi:DNA-binding IclR family transcriptional regulator
MSELAVAREQKGRAPEERNRVPVIDRMLDILDIIERRPDGVSIRELSDLLRLPRTTVYRVLNTLLTRGVIKRNSAGAFLLGPRLLTLATTLLGSRGHDLAESAKPHLKRFSESTGEACKISVRDGDQVLVLAIESGTREYGLSLKAGRLLPLHAGAASKVIMAGLPQEEIDRLLRLPMRAYTPRTITDADKLLDELRKIRRRGWGLDNSEYSNGMLAFAAPVCDRNGAVVAAVSCPFLDNHEPTRRERIKLAVIATAKAISDSFSGGRPERGARR